VTWPAPGVRTRSLLIRCKIGDVQGGPCSSVLPACADSRRWPVRADPGLSRSVVSKSVSTRTCLGRLQEWALVTTINPCVASGSDCVGGAHDVAGTGQQLSAVALPGVPRSHLAKRYLLSEPPSLTWPVRQNPDEADRSSACKSPSLPAQVLRTWTSGPRSLSASDRSWPGLMAR